jgi:cytochrome c-type biogenesis protein CcmH
MALWVIFALLTAIAALAILRPFWRPRPVSGSPAHDLEVYKQQLQEIEDEAARGLLAWAEANAARIEVSRRILAAAEGQADQRPISRFAYTPYVLAGLIPVIALSLYAIYGSPELPAQPLAARLAEAGQSVQVLVARVEERLARNPQDGMGWSVIAPVYMRLGRYADAAEAFRNASRLLGETAERSANLGEALALANDGTVDPEARQAFDKALSLEPNHSKSRFWIAISEEQAGRKAEAVAIYRSLLQGALPPAVAEAVNNRIALLEGGDPPATSPAPSDVGPAQINQMVSGLAERLKKDGSDLNGWLMLVRAYTVLGRKEDAVGALNDARGRFAGNNDALGQIDALAKSLGLPSRG